MFKHSAEVDAHGTSAALLLVLALTSAAPLAFAADKKKKNTAAARRSCRPGNSAGLLQGCGLPRAACHHAAEVSGLTSPPSGLSPLRPGKKQAQEFLDGSSGRYLARTDKTKALTRPAFSSSRPYGLAVDSKGRLYVADTKVGAIFIFNTENNDVELIKHGVHAKFGSIFGLAMDDNDHLFVSDGELHHVLVFNAKHELQAGFGDDVMKDPNGMAIDTENRFLYVADTGLDQVLVYDADTYKLLRKIGTTGKDHTLTDPGNFSKPTNVAVDKDGNLYVADTWNDRVEVFDADGTFIRTLGKNGDGPGDFARPKGIAIDADGHVWVADSMLNRLQVFTPEGHLLIGIGGFGIMPGQFEALTGLTIDKQNRVFTSEQLLGRAQMYRYVTNAEAKAEAARRQAELEKKSQQSGLTG